MSHHDKNQTRDFSVQLRQLSFEIRGLAYLLGQQSSDACPPKDVTDLHYGLGQILDRLGRRARRLARLIESSPRPSSDL